MNGTQARNTLFPTRAARAGRAVDRARLSSALATRSFIIHPVQPLFGTFIRLNRQLQQSQYDDITT
jgi:hypothetical protein